MKKDNFKLFLHSISAGVPDRRSLSRVRQGNLKILKLEPTKKELAPQHSQVEGLLSKGAIARAFILGELSLLALEKTCLTALFEKSFLPTGRVKKFRNLSLTGLW